MNGFRIRAELSSPIAVPGSRDVHIDSLLGWSWMMKNRPEAIDAISRQSIVDEISLDMHGLGLSVVKTCGHVLTASTAWILPDRAILRGAYWTRRKEGRDITRRASRIDPASLERPMLSRGDAIDTPYCDWFVFGDQARIESLLGNIQHVGALRAHGYGVVKRWTISTAHRSEASMLIYKGTAQRTLPAVLTSTNTLCGVSVRPPYWLPALQIAGVEPGQQIELSDAGRKLIDALGG